MFGCRPGEARGEPSFGSERSQIEPRWSWYLLCLIMTAGFAVRLYKMRGESVWYDESVCFSHLDAPDLVTFLKQMRAADPPMVPVYFTCQYLWGRVLAHTAVGARLLPIIFGTTTIPMVYLLARRVFNWVAGEVAAAMAALSISLAYYSQEMRPYALVTLLASMSAYALMEAMEKDSRSWLAANAVLNVLLVWSHLLASTVVVSQCFYVLWWVRRRPRKAVSWMVFHAVVAAGIAAWVATIDHAKLDLFTEWIRPPTLGFVPLFCMTLAGGTLVGCVVRCEVSHLGPGWAILIGVFSLCAVSIGLAMRDLYRKVGRMSSSQVVVSESRVFLMAAWLLFPLLFVTLGSFLWRPCFLARYILHVAVPLFVLAGGGVAWSRKRAVQWVVVLVFLASYAGVLYLHPRPWRLDFRGAAEYLAPRAERGEAIWVHRWLNAESLAIHMPHGAEGLRSEEDFERLCEKVLEARTGAEPIHVIVPSFREEFRQRLEEEGVDFTARPYEGLGRLEVFSIHVADPGSGGGV